MQRFHTIISQEKCHIGQFKLFTGVAADGVAIILTACDHTHMRRQLGGSRTVSDGDGSRLHTYLVPELLVKESLQCAGSPFYDKRLYAMSMQALHAERMPTVANHAMRIRPHPVAHGELWMLSLVGDTSHEDGIFLGTQLMAEHLGEGSRDG